MRLIIKDYLLCLREKDELDLLLCDLLLQMGYATDSQPKTGSRQYVRTTMRKSFCAW